MKFKIGDRVQCVAPDCACGGLVGEVLEVDEEDSVLSYFVHFFKDNGDDDSGWMMEAWLEAVK